MCKMIWFRLLYFVPLTWASPAVVYTTDQEKLQCLTDRDCPLSSYCFEESVCIKCMNCTAKNRLNAISRCAKFYEDCGSCLPGFVDDSFQSKLRCVPVKIIAEPQRMSDGVDKMPSWTKKGWYELLAVCSVALLVLMAYYYYHYNKRRTAAIPSSNCCVEDVSPPPPYPYEGHIGAHESENVAYSFHLRISEHSECKSNAVPFQLPKYCESGGTVAFSPPTFVNESYGSVDDAINVTAEGAVGGCGIIPAECNIDIHDENTTPSVWTPGSSYTSKNGITDEEVSATEKEVHEKVSPPNKRRKTQNLNPHKL